ncbi:MAG: transposase, partial [Bacteroidales bacterium]
VFERKAKNERYEHYFTYLNYAYRIRNLIYNTNWIEQLNRDYKRTTKMRGALPTVEATLSLLGYGMWRLTRKYYQYKITALKYENRNLDETYNHRKCDSLLRLHLHFGRVLRK